MKRPSTCGVGEVKVMKLININIKAVMAKEINVKAVARDVQQPRPLGIVRKLLLNDVVRFDIVGEPKGSRISFFWKNWNFDDDDDDDDDDGWRWWWWLVMMASDDDDDG